jgi:hypothetical protein
MKNLVRGAGLIAVFGFTSVGLADKVAKAPAADKGPTCGQMMAEKAVLPAKMAELVTAVAANAEAHAAFMLSTEPKSKEAAAEAEGLRKLAQIHRDLAIQFTKTSEAMKSAAAWPAAPHDMAKMQVDAKISESNKAMLTTHRDMAAMLQKEVAMMEKQAPAPKTN